jgi:glutathione S-transferase
VDLKNKPKDLLDLNPYAKVPVLVDGGGVVYESAIVNEYLEERYPAPRLLPVDAMKRAQTRIWVDFFNTRVHVAAHDLTHDKDPEQAKNRMAEHLKTLDRALSGKEYILDEYSLADVTFIPFYVRRERYRVTIDERFPNVRRWGESLLSRPAVASTL